MQLSLSQYSSSTFKQKIVLHSHEIWPLGENERYRELKLLVKVPSLYDFCLLEYDFIYMRGDGEKKQKKGR